MGGGDGGAGREAGGGEGERGGGGGLALSPVKDSSGRQARHPWSQARINRT